MKIEQTNKNVESIKKLLTFSPYSSSIIIFGGCCCCCWFHIYMNEFSNHIFMYIVKYMSFHKTPPPQTFQLAHTDLLPGFFLWLLVSTSFCIYEQMPKKNTYHKKDRPKPTTMQSVSIFYNCFIDHNCQHFTLYVLLSP